MSNSLLMEGVSDAVGFLGGALAGYWLGLDVFEAGYGNGVIVGILLVGLGGGGGLQLARRWQASRKKLEPVGFQRQPPTPFTISI